jgi:putative copper export protein
MHALSVLAIWMHVLAATVWIGGAVFLALVLVPVLRDPDLGARRTTLIHRTGVRFRSVSWFCFAVLVGTGILNLRGRGIGWADVADQDLWRSAFGEVLLLKMALVAAVLALSGVHDLVLGPRATRALRQAPDSVEARHLQRMARWIGRVTLLLGTAILAAAVMLTRGWPW